MRRFLLQKLYYYINGAVIGERHVEFEFDTGPTMTNTEENSNMDSMTMELVDQMDIEISETYHDIEGQRRSHKSPVFSKLVKEVCTCIN